MWIIIVVACLISGYYLGYDIRKFIHKKQGSTLKKAILNQEKILFLESLGLTITTTLYLLLLIWKGIDYNVLFNNGKFKLNSIFWNITSDNLIPAFGTLFLGILTWRMAQQQYIERKKSAKLTELLFQITNIYSPLKTILDRNTTVFSKNKDYISIEKTEFDEVKRIINNYIAMIEEDHKEVFNKIIEIQTDGIHIRSGKSWYRIPKEDIRKIEELYREKIREYTLSRFDQVMENQ